MKRGRVTATVSAVVLVIVGFLFVPLPVSRVRQTAMVQVNPDYIEKVYAPLVPSSTANGVILEELMVRDGERVEKGHVLARFSCMEEETQLQEAQSQIDTRTVQILTLLRQKEETTDPQERAKLEVQITQAQGEKAGFERQRQLHESVMRNLIVVAPRDGVVMSCPKKDEVGKQWEKDNAQPFCSVGDPAHLQALMPVPPTDYRLLKEDWESDPNLPVTLRVHGRADLKWAGKVARLQASEAKEVPPQLTTKHGGPLAVKPTSQPGKFEPQAQHFLVSVDFLAPDRNIHPGTLASVKVHCHWKSAAWWVWRKISSTFDLGLI